jgi:mannosyltransferase OCH1-like enzyme
MIPRIIHYCWLSDDPLPLHIQLYIDNWKEILKGYTFMLWNTETFNVHSVNWVSQAFESKKYAFAADYIRLYALYNYGGIYLDSDVELIRSFDSLLHNKSFIGRETSGDLEAAVIGSIPKIPWIEELLQYYESNNFVDPISKKHNTLPLPLLIEKLIKKSSFHIQNMDVVIYDKSYFSPKNISTGKIHLEPQTFCIHHFDGNWVKNNLTNRIKRRVHSFLSLVSGPKLYRKIIETYRLIRQTGR